MERRSSFVEFGFSKSDERGRGRNDHRQGGTSVGFLSRIVRSVYASAGCIRCLGRHLPHQAHDIDNEGMAVSG